MEVRKRPKEVTGVGQAQRETEKEAERALKRVNKRKTLKHGIATRKIELQKKADGTEAEIREMTVAEKGNELAPETETMTGGKGEEKAEDTGSEVGPRKKAKKRGRKQPRNSRQAN